MNDATRVLAGRYEVGELIGRGGMAEVHIGRDTRLGRTVAIKILRSDLARDPAFQARFRREAQAAAALNHPAIVAVYDTGEDVVVEPSGAAAHVPFIVMEYVEGHTVRDILRDGAAVPIDEAVEITTGVLSALAYSHHAGIVHRDIKPANVMLTPAGAVKVMDFGIARAVADSAATMTQTQAVIGTAQYLSPEQARGETVDARSDLYSTGCLLFELLTGRPPFVGDSPVSVAYQHVREDAPVPSALASDVPEALDRIVAKALSKDRETRYQTAAEFRADLEAYAHGGRVNAPAVGAAVAGAAATQVIGATPSATQVMAPTWAPTSPTGPPTDTMPPVPESSGRRWVWWTLAVVALVALAGIVVALLNQPPDVEMVVVPDVVGHSEEDARAELDEVGLEMRRLEEPSSEQEEGKVTRTDPEAEQQVEKGSTVDVWISTGPSEITVPDVAGATQEQARQAIEEAGLVWGQVTTVDSADQDRDRVVSTDPAIGDPITEGATVNVQLASGNVEVPSVVDQEQEAASQALTDLRMRTRIVEEASDAKAPGTVIRQDRQGLLPFNTLITLTVAIESNSTTVPDNLVGMTYEQAVAALQQANLVASRNDVASAQPAGTVISTSPNRGVTLPKGGTVTLNVSQGPPVETPPTP